MLRTQGRRSLTLGGNVHRESFQSTGKQRPATAPEKWPVLLRLPDVTQQLPAAARRSVQPGAATLGYRFDPPQAAGVGHGGAANTSTKHTRTRIEAGAHTRQPHLVERGPKPDRPRPAMRHASPILPQSDPFSTPSRSLSDTLAPLIRFLTLVALFAAAATWVQMLARRDANTKSTRPSAHSAAQSMKDMPQKTSPAPTATTSAAGPLDASQPRSVVARTSSRPGRSEDSFFRVVAGGTHTAGAPLAENQPLPHVQTTDSPANAAGEAPPRPPAIARLPGIIQAPTR